MRAFMMRRGWQGFCILIQTNKARENWDTWQLNCFNETKLTAIVKSNKRETGNDDLSAGTSKEWLSFVRVLSNIWSKGNSRARVACLNNQQAWMCHFLWLASAHYLRMSQGWEGLFWIKLFWNYDPTKVWSTWQWMLVVLMSPWPHHSEHSTSPIVHQLSVSASLLAGSKDCL